MRQHADTIVACHCRPSRGIGFVGGCVVATDASVNDPRGVSGYLAHYVASVLWTLVFERLLVRPR